MKPREDNRAKWVEEQRRKEQKAKAQKYSVRTEATGPKVETQKQRETHRVATKEDGSDGGTQEGIAEKEAQTSWRYYT